MPKILAAQRAACEANEARADERAAKLAPIIKSIQAKGVTSLNGLPKRSTSAGCLHHGAEAIGMRRRCGGCW
jgi:hypothetical protein